MPLINISADTKEISRLLEQIDDNIESGYPELHKRFATTLARRAEKAFAEEGYPERWPQSEAAKREGRRTLDRTGTLRRSFILEDPRNFFITSGPEMLFGSNVDYGPYHYDEDQAKTLREIIIFDDELIEELDGDMDDWLQEMIDNASNS